MNKPENIWLAILVLLRKEQKNWLVYRIESINQYFLTYLEELWWRTTGELKIASFKLDLAGVR